MAKLCNSKYGWYYILYPQSSGLKKAGPEYKVWCINCSVDTGYYAYVGHRLSLLSVSLNLHVQFNLLSVPLYSSLIVFETYWILVTAYLHYQWSNVLLGQDNHMKSTQNEWASRHLSDRLYWIRDWRPARQFSKFYNSLWTANSCILYQVCGAQGSGRWCWTTMFAPWMKEVSAIMLPVMSLVISDFLRISGPFNFFFCFKNPCANLSLI